MATGYRATTRGMRSILVVGGTFVLIAGFQLSVLTESTDVFFAWTIDFPMTAAFLGAYYWVACIIAFLSARESEWARARAAVPAVTVFVWLTLLATLLHLDLFHLGSEDLLTAGAAWAWLAVYLLEPPVLLGLYLHQISRPGDDPSRTNPAPRWMRALLWVHAGAPLIIGTTLFVAPGTATALWPWGLTPLTARAAGAWLIAHGLLAIAAIWENNLKHLGPAMLGFCALVLFQGVALIRFRDDLEWGRPQMWIYVGFLLSAGAMGVLGWLRSGSEDSS
jgi:hypothetical protein